MINAVVLKDTIPALTYPKLVSHKGSSLVVYALKELGGGFFQGIVLVPSDSTYTAGSLADFRVVDFVDFDHTVQLSNNK